MKSSLREYGCSDYEACESLVNDAWKFDVNFKPQEISNIAKCMYTKGSIINSNFRKVVESDGKVVGFIFGLNEIFSKPKRKMWFGINTLRRILCVKGMSYREKIRLLGAINAHEVNRSKLAGRGRSEIVLFVVDPDHQGYGNGKRLLSEFIVQCRNSGVKSIIVETNSLGASSFYESVGFQHLGDFYSPLHEYATKGGQACMYEYRCE